MASISLLTGPMGLLADRFTMQNTSATTATTLASPAASACPSSASNAASNTASVYTLAYRCHRSAVSTWSVAAVVAMPLAWLASQLALFAVMLADCVSRAAYVLASLALRLGYAAANSTAVLAMEAWACRRAERMRNKIYFEIALVLLGPGGNLLLVVLWPGWILLAAATSALWAAV